MIPEAPKKMAIDSSSTAMNTCQFMYMFVMEVEKRFLIWRTWLNSGSLKP